MRLAPALLAAAALAAPAAAADRQPTSGRCAGAWNRRPAPALLAAVRRAHARQATVTTVGQGQSQVVWRNGRVVGSSSGSERVCLVVFFLGRRDATVQGVWRGGTVVRWSRPVYRPAQPGSGNACVARDGTLRRVGPYTAATRCR